MHRSCWSNNWCTQVECGFAHHAIGQYRLLSTTGEKVWDYAKHIKSGGQVSSPGWGLSRKTVWSCAILICFLISRKTDGERYDFNHNIGWRASRKMEPRTAAATKRLKVVGNWIRLACPRAYNDSPGIIPDWIIMKYLRCLRLPLNMVRWVRHDCGSVERSYRENIWRLVWCQKLSTGLKKVWNQICDMHGGDVNDSQFGRRMRGGVGRHHPSCRTSRLYRTSKKKYFDGRGFPPYDLTKFRKAGMLSLFWLQ